MGYGPRSGGDWPDDSGEHVRPGRRPPPGSRRVPPRDATDPRGYRPPVDYDHLDDGYGGGYDDQGYGRAGHAAEDYGRGDWGYGGGYGGGGGRDRGSILPHWLPLWPTVLAAGTAVIFAFMLGRVTAGGGDSSSADSNSVAVKDTTTTISLTPSTHIVARDETLAGIASKYGVTIDELAIANNLGDVNHVFVGQNLKIPPPTSASATTTTTKKKSNN